MAMNNETEERVKLRREIVEGGREGRPASVVELAGSWSEDDFPTLAEIRVGVPPDSPREPL
jgi:hypothetical protein